MNRNEFEGERGLLLRGARVVGPSGVSTGDVLVRGGRIARLSPAAGDDASEGDSAITSDDLNAGDGAAPLDLKGLTLMPGFVDVHTHGAAGVDVNEAGAESLRRAAGFLATRGVTAWLPTLVPGPDEEYGRAARAVGELMRTQEEGEPAARALGLHYEGPFVNEKQCGALRTRFFRDFRNAAALDTLIGVGAEGARHLVTLAPEIEGGIALVAELVRRGWVVSLGHTRADVETLEKARAAGARHMTHFMNAMPQLHHRAPGPVGWGLAHDEVSVDVIADGVHCDPLVLRLVVRAKTAERVSLISDSVAPAGLGDGEFRLWGETIRVSGGRTANEKGGIAGSVITMLEAVRMMMSLGVPEHEVARMASLNPARLLGLGDEMGSIEEGKRADLVALDVEGRVRLTLVGGRMAFDDLSLA
jgi:N-acetylglucosamine-6-phosphate deacetylase